MPLEELLVHLTLTNDAITSHRPPGRNGHDGEIMTKNGLRYVTSTEGLLHDGKTWLPKVRWNRF